MAELDPNLKREIIMDHYEYPRNHVLKDLPGFKKVHMASDSCIDDIHVEARIENGIIEEVNFTGVACTISTASTSIMSELVKGKTIAEAKEIMQNYYDMIDNKDYNEDLLQEAVAFDTVGKQANRIKCATIGWHGLEKLIEESENNEQ